MTVPRRRSGARVATALLVVLLLAAGCEVDDLAGGGRGGDGGPDATPGAWEEEAAAIDGITNYREERPEILTSQHQSGPLTYDVLPPVGGDHHPAWLNCQGTVYDDQVPNEHAVHSLEHGAVWITYRPDLPGTEVDALAERVRGMEKLFMSPFPGLDAPVSLQAWGYQLRVGDAGDPRIDEFIAALRVNTSLEGPGVACSGGVTVTGTNPID